MKTFFCAAVGVLAAGLGTPASAITERERISGFNDEDFAFAIGGPEPDNPVNGIEVRGLTLDQLPSLAGIGLSMFIVNLEACGINLPHIHPRATEMLYVIEGNNLRVAFVEENGGEGAVVNDLYKGDASFVPQALIHYQQNLDCEPASYLVALNSEDPGSVTITTNFFELPSEAIQATLNIDDPTLAALLDGLPEAPALARLECLERCALMNDDNLSHSYDYDGYA